jgi:hypothetical protein
MKLKSIKRYIPLGISVGFFVSLFVFFVSQSERKEIDVQLSPRHASYFEIFGKPEAYSQNYLTTSGEITNVRINKKPGASEPKIVTNPLNKDIFAVVANDFSSEGYASIFLTEDGGLEWKQSYIPLSLVHSSDMYYADPWADYDSKGNLAYVTVAMKSTVYMRKIILNVSHDNGNTWMNDPVTVKSLDDESIKLDKPKVNFNQNEELFVAWLEKSPSGAEVYVNVSRDRGRSFDQDVKVAEGDIEYADILFDGSNSYIIYSEDREEIKLIISNDGGRSWSEPFTIAEFSEYEDILNKQRVIKSNGTKGVRVNSDPQAIISNGKLFLSFAGLSYDGGEHSEAFYVTGDLRDMKFTEPKALCNAPGTDRFLPAILQDKNGVIHVLYYTSQNDPSNLITEVHLATSKDFGNSFTYRNLSTENFNPYDIVVDGSYMGDYISLAINDGKLIGVWTDGRNETMDVIAGIVRVN